MEPAPQPQSATTSAEFVAMLRQLRSWAGLSLRDLERRAASTGGALPRATVSGALKRTELPREEFVAAYVRACGMDPDTAEIWVSTRRRLAVASEPLPTPAPTTERHTDDQEAAGGIPDSDEQPECAQATTSETDDRAETSAIPGQEELPASVATAKASRRTPGRVIRKRAVLAAGTATALTALVLGTLAFWPNDLPQDAAQPSASRSGNTPASSHSPKPSKSPRPVLAPGTYRMRAAADGRCVAERRDGNPETGEPGLFLISCTTRESDRVTLEETGNGTYQLIFPRAKGESPGCLGVLGASLQDGGAVTIDPCGSRELNEAEEFRLEKTSDHGGGFRLRADHLRFVPVDRRQDLCIGAPDGDHTEWANVFQLACNESGTVFRFLR